MSSILASGISNWVNIYIDTDAATDGDGSQGSPFNNWGSAYSYISTYLPADNYCSYDVIFSGSTAITSMLTIPVAWDGGMSATNVIRLRAADSDRAGKVWDSNKFRFSVSAQDAILVECPWIIIEGLQIEIESVNFADIAVFVDNWAEYGAFELCYNHIRQSAVPAEGVSYNSGLEANDVRITQLLVHNNIVADFETALNPTDANSRNCALWCHRVYENAATMVLFAYNTMVNCGYGILNAYHTLSATYHDGIGTIAIYNNLAVDCDRGGIYSVVACTEGGGNSVDDEINGDYVPGTNYENQTITFADLGNGNYGLASNDTGAMSRAVDLSSHSTFPIDDDIDGEARDVSTPDAGADEYSASSSHSLTADNILAGSPVLGSPALSTSGVDNLTADNLVSRSPVLSAPDITQAHSLSADGITAGTPVIGGLTTLVIDHESVIDFDSLTTEQIAAAKQVLMIIAGESHGRAYGYGLELLESDDSTYDASTNWSGAAEAYRSDALRWNRDFLDGAVWNTSMGEEDFWTNAAAIADVKTGLGTIEAGYSGRILFGFGWCWDMTWLNGVTASKDPVYGCGWAGSSIDGPDGNLPWGLDADDTSITLNSVSLADYLAAVEEYKSHAPGVTTIFTTGPVDNDYGDGTYNSELGYQRWLKHEAIRAYVQANGGILFDYADILSWDYTNSQRFTESWDGHSWDGINTAYDDASYDGGQGGCHITADACRQLAKGLWVMAAKLAEIDAPSLGVIDGQANLSAESIATEAPVLSSPALGQVHGLEALGITAGEPVLASPAHSAGDIVGLTANGILSGIPVLSSPEFWQKHTFIASNILALSPDLESVSISQVQALEAVSILTQLPALASPVLNNPIAVGIVTADIQLLIGTLSISIAE